MSLIKDGEFRSLLLIAITTLFVGTIFYHFVENLVWLDSIYISVITLTTVGYGDITPTSPASKIFTIFYAIFGIVLFFGFINYLAKKPLQLHLFKSNSKSKLKSNKTYKVQSPP